VFSSFGFWNRDLFEVVINFLRKLMKYFGKQPIIIINNKSIKKKEREIVMRYVHVQVCHRGKTQQA
jgi:hypothetical protein